MANVTKLNIGGTDYDIVDASVPSWAKQSTKPSYTANEISGLANVATSGSYNDLTNKPTIPAAITVDSTITQNGTNPVQGGAIYTALEGKQDRQVEIINLYYNGYEPTWTNSSGDSMTTVQVNTLLRNSSKNVIIKATFDDIGRADGTRLYYRTSPIDDDYIMFYALEHERVYWIGIDANLSDYSLMYLEDIDAVDISSYVKTSFKINNKPLSGNNMTLNASDVGAVPTTRKVNNKALSSDITLTASDVGADVFVINIASNGNNGYTCNKTNTEIYAAWQAGRNIVLITSSDGLYKLNEKPTQTYCEFSGDDYDDLGGYRHYTIFTSDGQQNVREQYIYFQEYLQSGTNIKTINNRSLLGSGNLTISDIGLDGVAFIGDDDGTGGIVDGLGQLVDISLYATKAELESKYEKPSSGIPKSDLSTEVLSSLNKADTALLPASLSGNIKTICNNSLVGSGNVNLTAADVLALPASTSIPSKTSDLTNDSGFTSNTGTITGITMNGASKGTSGIVNLGTVLTEHLSIKTINNNTITGTGNITISELPAVSSSDNGKVLKVNNGQWEAITPVTIYSGTSTPSNTLGVNGDIYIQTT